MDVSFYIFDLLLFVNLISWNVDLIKRQFGLRTVYLAEKQSNKELFVMKMIFMGQEGTDERKRAQKEVAAEILIGMTIGQDCKFLVKYFETFNHKNYNCLIMEYCDNGDLQTRLNNKETFEEWVSYQKYHNWILNLKQLNINLIILFFFMIFFIFTFFFFCCFICY
jgi:serine/threonine protein kinase